MTSIIVSGNNEHYKANPIVSHKPHIKLPQSLKLKMGTGFRTYYELLHAVLASGCEISETLAECLCRLKWVFSNVEWTINLQMISTAHLGCGRQMPYYEVLENVAKHRLQGCIPEMALQMALQFPELEFGDYLSFPTAVLNPYDVNPYIPCLSRYTDGRLCLGTNGGHRVDYYYPNSLWIFAETPDYTGDDWQEESCDGF